MSDSWKEVTSELPKDCGQYLAITNTGCYIVVSFNNTTQQFSRNGVAFWMALPDLPEQMITDVNFMAQMQRKQYVRMKQLLQEAQSKIRYLENELAKKRVDEKIENIAEKHKQTTAQDTMQDHIQ